MRRGETMAGGVGVRRAMPRKRRSGVQAAPARQWPHPTDAGVAISVVLPVHASGAALLERALLALAGQDLAPERFEVVVAADDGDAHGALAGAIAAAPRPFACRLVTSPRPHGDLPHRNHARNAGCVAARGALVWPLDADFLLPPQALRHAQAQFNERLAAGRVCVLTPCMAAIALSPGEWLAATAPAVMQGDGAALWCSAIGVPRLAPVFAGFGELYQPGAAAASRPLARLNEGMPLLPARLLAAVGGFDEAFIGWGANKQELSRRLDALAGAGLIELRLLNSVRALHQPHPADPDKRADSVRRRHNAALLSRKARDIRRDARWWAIQRGAVQQALQAISCGGGGDVRAVLQASPPSTGTARARTAESAPRSGSRAVAGAGTGAGSGCRIAASIIVPVGFERGFLGAALASAAAQAYPADAYEVIVVNDGCEGVDEAAVRALWTGAARLEYLAQARKGLSASVNLALGVARGDYYTILPDDDRIHAHKLKLLCGELDRDRAHDVLYSLPRYIDRRGRPIETPPVLREFLLAHSRLTWAHIAAGDGLVVHGVSTVYRRSLIERFGGWDEQLDTAEEYELHLRLLRSGIVFRGIDSVTTDYRIHTRNKSRGYRGKRQRQMAYIERKLAAIPPPAGPDI